MEKDQESGSPSWSASFFMETTEDVARAVAAAAVAVHSPLPSVVYSSKDKSGSQLQRLKHHVSRILQGLSSPPKVKSGPYNPEIPTRQKRQWAYFQLQSPDHRVWKEPSKLFESMVVVGLLPNSDIQALQNLYSAKMSEDSGRFHSALGGPHQYRVEPILEPLILFIYPPEKQLPLKYKDLLSFCFPAGVEVNAVERTPSMSELNEILLGQVADDSTLYGCCVLVEGIIQKPSGLISMISDGQPLCSSLSRHVLTTHPSSQGERLERLTKQVSYLDLESPVGGDMVDMVDEKAGSISPGNGEGNMQNGIVESSQSSTSGSNHNNMPNFENKNLNEDSYTKNEPNDNDFPLHPETELASRGESAVDTYINDCIANKQSAEKHLPNAVLSFLRYQQCESSESSSSFQGSPSKDRHFRSDVDEAEIEEASPSGQDIFSEHRDILKWAKVNNHGSLRIICEYYRLCCPKRGSTIKFHPLDHLHPLEYHRPDETVLQVAGSTVDLRSCNTSLELAEVLTLFAGVLLEKQILVVCSNLVLPNDMLDFLDALVPYIVGVKNKTTEMQSKLTNVILVDANRNQVRSPTIPQLPRHRELYSCLSPYHDKLVGESYLGKKRPVYECTDVQVEAAKGFLGVLRSYLDYLCSNLRSHTITNVQSNDDKVSLLLRESFIESFPSRDQPFMKLFVDTQLFSVHTDFVLSFFQRE